MCVVVLNYNNNKFINRIHELLVGLSFEHVEHENVDKVAPIDPPAKELHEEKKR